jgi:NO-binding membrane sensor protein with MHYT domain
MSWLVPAVPPDPSMCIVGPNGSVTLHWDWTLVFISFAVAVVGSFGALEFPERIRANSHPGQRRRWFVLGALLMGLAIWTMHFVGMLALRMPMPVSYTAGWSVLSMIAAVFGAALAFWITTRPRKRKTDLLVGGIAMGLAIVSMHYLGMKSMRLSAVIDYEPAHFAASVVIAILASFAALAIGRRGVGGLAASPWIKGGAAVILGIGIAGMHYMGMAAARYEASGVEDNRTEDPMVGPVALRDIVELAGVVFGATLMALAVRTAAERERAIRDYERLAAQLEHRIHERTQELQRTNDDLVAFTDSVSHDLRGPLRTIAGFADALLDSYGERLDETGTHYVHRIKAVATRLDELLLGLLKLSQVSRAAIHRTEVDLTDLARVILADLAVQEPERRVSTLIAEGLKASGDRALLVSVLQNLLGNAWKFTRDQPDAKIEFATGPGGPPTVFAVRDNGAGFDNTNAARLFGMFERMHAPSQFQGHGVGLALTKRIVERHGGRIWAESAPGQGAAFYFTLGE